MGSPNRALSKRTLETLLDLVEIKLSCMEVWDREDRRELQSLEFALQELHALERGAPAGQITALTTPRRGRPRADAALRQSAAC